MTMARDNTAFSMENCLSRTPWSCSAMDSKSSLGFYDGNDDVQHVVCFLYHLLLFFHLLNPVLLFLASHCDGTVSCRWCGMSMTMDNMVQFISFITLFWLPNHSVIFSFLSAQQWQRDDMGWQTTYGDFLNIVDYSFFFLLKILLLFLAFYHHFNDNVTTWDDDDEGQHRFSMKGCLLRTSRSCSTMDSDRFPWTERFGKVQ